MKSPCIQLCVIDRFSGLCEGCGRTIEEVSNWTRYTDAERDAVMAALPKRLRPSNKAIARLKKAITGRPT